jgi:hypothetical protein
VFFDRMRGPYVLDAPASATSPDGKTRFEADPDGTVRLVEAKSGRLLHFQRVPVADYRAVQPTWEKDRVVTLVFTVRYPAMATYVTYLWDRTSGFVLDEWSKKVRDFGER